jgi:ribosomal-protein-alanine N-acetyltransferase
VIQLLLAGVHLRPWRRGDEESLVHHANNRNVWINLDDLFPFPYTMDNASIWIQHCVTEKPSRQFAIVVEGQAVGGIGILLKEGIRRKTAEIGYWLGENFWNKGITTEAVKAVTEYAFSTFDICRIQATVFPYNKASGKVLEKAGYTLESCLKKGIIKDGKIIDEHIYAIVR